MSLPEKHLCVFHEKGGSSSVIKEALLPLPTRRKGELLIRVQAASVNPKDWKVRQELRGDLGCKSCLGEDIAGNVVDCDPGSKFRKGDRVYAMMNMLQWLLLTNYLKR